MSGLKKEYSTSHEFLGADPGAPGIVARFFAVLFVHLFLFLAGLTGFLIWLLLLLLARFLPAALLLTAFAALLVLLIALIGHGLN